MSYSIPVVSGDIIHPMLETPATAAFPRWSMSRAYLKTANQMIPLPKLAFVLESSEFSIPRVAST